MPAYAVLGGQWGDEGKGKIVDFMTETLGLTRRQAIDICEQFSESGRWMAIHSWSPVVLYGPKLAMWV